MEGHNQCIFAPKLGHFFLISEKVQGRSLPLLPLQSPTMFLCIFLTAIRKVLVLEGGLATRLCVHPNLIFF